MCCGEFQNASLSQILTVEDNLLLVLGPELGGMQLLVHLDFVVLSHAVLWCLLGVASQLGYRLSVSLH